MLARSRKAGALIIADTGHSRVLRCVRGSDGWTLETQLGGPGTEPGRFILPIGVAVDEDGSLYVADAYNNRIQRWELPQASTPPANQSPTAAFTAQCSGLSCTFTSTSTDSDGTITSHAWDFGDGITATGPSPSHTYLTGGTYTVTLTVTDDQGATAATAQAITVTAPSTSQIELSASGYKVKGVKRTDLTWTGATSTNVDVYRSGARIATTANDGAYTDNLGTKGSGSYTYKVCEAGTGTCSREVAVTF
jgi:PKD repeat protein